MTMNLDFFLDALEEDDFEEKPVKVEEFVYSKEYLGIAKLSDYQMTIVKAMTQILKPESLKELYGEEYARERFKQTNNEIILQLGKGSGKDFTSTIAVAYIVYLLLCMRDPAEYYGRSSGEPIDIINIAVNADQAKRVFFEAFVNRVKKCKWFAGKFDAKGNEIEFDKNVTVYSGHSEREAFEGYNTLVVILDEISGFAMATDEEVEEGKPPPKTSQAIYDMYSASVTSRFATYGKLVSLSFPRFKDDFIQQLYKKNAIEKETVMRKHTFKFDPDLPDGTEGNEFEIEWEEDHIIRYKYAKTFALRRPSWEVNPETDINDPSFVKAFAENPGDALARYACMPDNAASGFFKNKEIIDKTFTSLNGVDESGVFHERFLPEADKEYYVHVDLAQKHDKAAVAMAHIDRWLNIQVSEEFSQIHPEVVVDAVRWWTPTADKSVDFADVREYIIALRRRGFNVKLVTFDRWNSHDTMNILEREYGIDTDVLSVAKKHYDDFLSVMYDRRLRGPDIELLRTELKELKEVKGKVDHPRKGSKDLSDAVCGAIFNAIAHTEKPAEDIEVEVLTYKDVRARLREQAKEHEDRPGVIRVPERKEMPPDLEEWLNTERARIL